MSEDNLRSSLRRYEEIMDKQLLKKDFKRNYDIYIMAIPVLVYFLIFHYGPMYGLLIAFKNYNPMKGIWGSPWVGMKHFQDFFSSYYFIRIFRNTILLSVYQLVFCFPASIILALLINELTCRSFKRVVQTVSYLPHFISIMVLCGLVINFCGSDGLINDILVKFGIERRNLMQDPALFRPIYILSSIWQEIGWNSIVYLAVLGSIDESLYDAAVIDGAGRLRQVFAVTLPAISNTILVMFLLKVGRVMNVGYEKILLLYNPVVMETADVISTFVYRRGILESNFSYSAAVGLFPSYIIA